MRPSLRFILATCTVHRVRYLCARARIETSNRKVHENLKVSHLLSARDRCVH